MARNFGVTQVERLGQRVVVDTPPPTQPVVPQDKLFIGVLDQGRWRIAKDLTHPVSYTDHYEDYVDGFWTNIVLYLLKVSDVEKCPDERRVSNDS